MPYSLLANLVLLLHVSFVVFVLFGGLLALRWPRTACFHLPAAVWGAFVEFSGWICPLTPLENWLRAKGGGLGYEGDFLGYYLLALLYPDGVTRTVQVALGTIVVALNLAIYAWGWRAMRRS